MGDAAKIICPNQLCQTPNPETQMFCQQCRTSLPKRYLWVVGNGLEAYKPGKLLAERYLYKRDRILLDTKPGFIPSFPAELSDRILPYLRLFPYRLHIPQVYGQLILKKGKGEPLWLLEQAPIWVNRKNQTPSLMPELAIAWKDASAIRQLNWLWQIASLWEPFSRAGVASSLIEPKLLRVEGPIVRSIELKLDRSEVSLSYLGETWRAKLKDAKPNIGDFLAGLCDLMIRGQMYPDELVAHLERALHTVGGEQTRTYQVATLTDTGPIRQRNEDACYPPSGSFYRIPGDRALAVVCDGIGGHEGGNVASNLAIETVISQASRWQSQNLSPTGANVSLDLNLELENTVCQANDRISKRNDTEGRSDRQRMGTTLVMAISQAHQMYVTHIGDSRIYWITRTGCHQITLDDDVATREVRLGYSLYREALQQVGSGSLVQALGMSSSTNLHPTLQKFVLDEDSIFLLCSDGLSDYDRVEQNWETEILPVLEGKVDLASAAARAVEIGNSQNGHDNVTVALVYCQVSRSEDTRKHKSVLAAPALSSSPYNETTELPNLVDAAEISNASTLKTQVVAYRPQRFSLLPLLLSILVLLGLTGVIGYFVLGKWPEPTATSGGITPQIQPHTPSLDTSVPGSNTVSSLTIGSVIQVKSASSKQAEGERTPFVLYEGPQKQKAIGIVSESSILEIIKKQAVRGQETWLQIKVCLIPTKKANTGNEGRSIAKPSVADGKSSPSPITNSQSSLPFLRVQQEGWVRESDLKTYIEPNVILAADKLGKCNIPASSAKPTPNR